MFMRSVDKLAWFAVGAMVGTAAGILLAPDKGIHTRRKLQNHLQTQDIITRGRELYEKGREIAQEASDMFEHGRQMAEADFDQQLEEEPKLERGF